MFHRKAAASIRTRNLRRSIPPTFFSCAAALSFGLEKIIEKRAGRRALGFHTDAVPSTPQQRNTELLEQVQPGDLIRYGLIPEFVGRLPVAGVMNISTSPRSFDSDRAKNALLKQYQRLFEFEKRPPPLHRRRLSKPSPSVALQRKGWRSGLRMISKTSCWK